MSKAGQDVMDDAPPKVDVHDYGGGDDVRPPLPPRPNVQSTLQKPPRPQLQPTATTALSLTDIHTQSFQDGSRETYAAQAETTSLGRFPKGLDSIRRLKGHHGSEADSASVRSYAPTLEAGGDVESLLGELLGATPETPTWRLAGEHTEGSDIFEATEYEDEDNVSNFDHEFDEMDELRADADNEGEDHQA
jgi:hypothetical protein